MWPRTVEAMLGCWLAISPFVFRFPAERSGWWRNDWATAAAVIALALVSFVHQTRRAHLLTLGVAAWLIAYGWLGSTGGLGEPAEQNRILVGLLLLMTAILPSECDRPPAAWEKWNREHGVAEDG